MLITIVTFMGGECKTWWLQAEIARLKAKGLEPKVVKEKRPVHAYSTGVAAASFTSTAQDVVTVNENKEFSDEDMRDRIYRRVKKKNAKG